MTVGPDGAPYYIGPARPMAPASRCGASTPSATGCGRSSGPGDGPNQGIAAPRLLAAQAADLLVVDSRGDLWRWRPSNDKNGGSLTRRRIPGEQVWGDDVRDVGTLMVSLSRGTYNMYVLDPSLDQILRYSPTLDGGQFQGPDDYLAAAEASVRGLPAAVCRPRLCTRSRQRTWSSTRSGRPQDFDLETPPDDGDMRPGHEYRLIDGTSAGKLYVYDEKWNRILVFLKSDGGYLSQWSTRGALPSMADMRGMYVSQPSTPRGQSQAPPARVIWSTPTACTARD